MLVAARGGSRPVFVVTGASGFLGGAVARALAERGESVRALVRRTSDVRALHRAGIATAVGDVVDGSGLSDAFARARVVVHAAGMLGRPGVADGEYEAVHVRGTLNVVEAARAAGVERVVHVSSPGLLGPIGRSAPDADEEAPPNPTNAYERSKAAAEAALREEAARNGPLAVIVRPEFVYGPGDRHVLGLFRVIRRRRFVYVGRGEALCHPTYVDDAVGGILAAADRGRPGRTYHVAGPRPVPVRELVETFARACGVAPPFIHLPEWPVRFGVSVLERLTRRIGVALPLGSSAVDFFTLDRHFSWRRAEAELGFRPRVDLDEGARRAVRAYEEEGLIA
jgi:nucleoside-diphosphate-sugar epimerase